MGNAIYMAERPAQVITGDAGVDARVAAPTAPIGSRTAAIHALDPLVRRCLPRLWPLPLPAEEDLTIYDALYASGPELGGHWTTTVLLAGMMLHVLWSYTIALAFDTANQPDYFVITGAKTVVTPDVSEAALARGVEQAQRGGPVNTWAPSAFAGAAL